MKKLLLISIIFLSTYTTNAQKILTDSVLVKGFYKTIEEFSNNSPSIPFDYKIFTENIKLNFGGPKADVFRIEIDKKAAKNIGEIIGFSDGKDIYFTTYAKSSPLSFSDKLKPNTDFVKVLDLGKYTYFQSLSVKTRPAGATGTIYTRYVSDNIINLETNESFELNVKLMKKLLADEPDLLNIFDEDKDRKKNLSKYIIQYNDRKKLK